MKITAIKQQVRRAGRYSVFVDERYAFSLSEAALVERRLASGQELTPDEFRALKQASVEDKIFNTALRYVTIRRRSERELNDYFRRKGVDKAVGAQVAGRLRQLGLLDDHDFTEAWVNNRRTLKAVSKRRLQQELHQKGVASSIIDAVLADDETTDQAVLLEVIRKKRARYPDRQKFMAYLARQGFGFDDIKSALDAEGPEL